MKKKSERSENVHSYEIPQDTRWPGGLQAAWSMTYRDEGCRSSRLGFKELTPLWEVLLTVIKQARREF